MKNLVFVLFFTFVVYTTKCQEVKNSFQIQLPTQPSWNVVSEGNRLEFKLKVIGDNNDTTAVFRLIQGQQEAMTLDSTGLFVWEPDYDVADRINTHKTIQLLIEAQSPKNEKATRTINLEVIHVNRSPKVEVLSPFYVQYRVQNNYKIDTGLLKDDDDDPVVVIPIAETLPEGAKLTAQGELTWQPSQTQYNQLKANPIFIDFLLEDQPHKARTKGRVKIEATQLDLPPTISQVPKNEIFRLKENATVSLKFFLADPNGDDDITTFDFVSQNPQITQNSLIKNTPNQYEFIWTPDYDFVKDPLDSLAFDITFFVLDKSLKREERKVFFVVKNAINEAQRDKELYEKYHSTMIEAWNLMTQLAEKEQQLKQLYLKAKKGKKYRSMLTASLGAITGITPALTKVTDTRVLVSAIGGTTILTVGTLEATEVIGRSLKDVLERYNYVVEKRIEVQNKGDIFAREFALKSSRRSNDFIRKRDEFRQVLNLKGPVTLDLDASWENKKEATDKAIGRIFKDFALMTP